ncbi:replication initiator [Actinomadura sp. DC4]|uniref:replication initiator n=1 Tax=Actinomadura sp. DC4 TaxID=3055069 RepID=UPI0025B22B1A|nr:replication initiator [Actinomadura sp. DC4]MDN3360188.1 replication initiation protein [Actinomadura sp. DC4]
MTGPQIPGLTAELAAAAQRASMPDFTRWQEMIKSAGGCEQPVRLRGERVTLDGETGELIESYTTDEEPTGYLITACGNRRASRCAACAEVYRDDTYHLIISGLSGGKGVDEQVSAHPRVFLTLTAPSFGAVHAHKEKSGQAQPCRPRKNRPLCQHGRPQGCGRRHDGDDSMAGQPICADCYDYPAAVLWNAHAPELWRRLTLTVPMLIKAELGITHKALRRQVRISYARVIEYQRRGLIHFHAVVRLDGPDGPGQAPPSWATTELLERVLRTAAAQVEVPVPHPDAQRPPLVLRWGRQLDIQPIQVAAELDGMADKHVARYVAKYATKGAEDSGTVDRPIRYATQISSLKVSEHARRMIWTCFTLAGLPEYQELRLRKWAHMLGYGGHFSSKSRRYSVTLTQLRQARADHAAQAARQAEGLPEPDPNRNAVTVGRWKYAGAGLMHGEHFWAQLARDQVQRARRMRQQLTERDETPKVS